MRAPNHRGAAEIGGNCELLEAAGKRLVLNVGRPLWDGPEDEIPLPSIGGNLATEALAEGVAYDRVAALIKTLRTR